MKSIWPIFEQKGPFSSSSSSSSSSSQFGLGEGKQPSGYLSLGLEFTAVLAIVNDSELV